MAVRNIFVRRVYDAARWTLSLSGSVQYVVVERPETSKLHVCRCVSIEWCGEAWGVL